MAAWMTGPSALGSENGTPSSITSAPALAAAITMSAVAAGDGSPSVRYAISAGRRSRLQAARRARRRAPVIESFVLTGAPFCRQPRQDQEGRYGKRFLRRLSEDGHACWPQDGHYETCRL